MVTSVTNIGHYRNGKHDEVYMWLWGNCSDTCVFIYWYTASAGDMIRKVRLLTILQETLVGSLIEGNCLLANGLGGTEAGIKVSLAKVCVRIRRLAKDSFKGIWFSRRYLHKMEKTRKKKKPMGWHLQGPASTTPRPNVHALGLSSTV